eukprot:scaffold28607_cov17-Tisochrysis_lutea.AAC.1
MGQNSYTSSTASLGIITYAGAYHTYRSLLRRRNEAKKPEFPSPASLSRRPVRIKKSTASNCDGIGTNDQSGGAHGHTA